MKSDKVSTIMIDGKPFSYRDERGVISFTNNVAMNHDSGKKLLYKVKELFGIKHIRFSLAFGTLLGAVREHDLIKGDEDLDVFTDQEDRLRSAIPWLAEQGLVVTRVKEGDFYSFRIDEQSYIDVYILRPFKFSLWGIWCYSLSDCATPKYFFKNYQKITFLGEDFLVPSNPEKLVEFWYGEDWRVPKSGKKYYYEVKSRYYWKFKGMYIKKFLAYFLGDKTDKVWIILKSIIGR